MISILNFFHSSDSKSNGRFMDIYNKYSKLIYKVALDYLYDKTFAADCVQDTFLELFKAFDVFDSLSHPRQEMRFLITICKRCAIKINNKNQKIETVPFEDYFSDETADPQSADCFEQTDLLGAVETLDEKYRAPLVMKYVDGYSNKEIGEKLGMSENLVKQRIFRSKQMIKTILEEKEE